MSFGISLRACMEVKSKKLSKDFSLYTKNKLFCVKFIVLFVFMIFCPHYYVSWYVTVLNLLDNFFLEKKIPPHFHHRSSRIITLLLSCFAPPCGKGSKFLSFIICQSKHFVSLQYRTTVGLS